MSRRHPSTVVDGLASLFEHERVHFFKMIASLMPILNMLTSADLGPLLSPDAADTRDPRRLTSMAECIERAQVVYLGLDALSDSMVGSAIGSILVADLAAVAGDRYNYGVGLKPVNVFIDEAAEVVNDPFIQLLNKGRGAGLRLTVATQTFADFAARTGSEAKARQVLGNINNLIALRVLDAETQQYVTDSLPKTRLKSLLLTQGSTTHSQNPLLYTGNVGERLGEEEGDLFRRPCSGSCRTCTTSPSSPAGASSRGACRSWARRRRPPDADQKRHFPRGCPPARRGACRGASRRGRDAARPGARLARQPGAAGDDWAWRWPPRSRRGRTSSSASA